MFKALKARYSHVFIILFAIGGLITGTGSSSDDSYADPVAEFAAGVVPAARRAQLTAYAAEEGISVDAAIDMYAWQTPFAYLVNELREKYPNDFAGAQIEDDLTAWIAFSGTVPSGAKTSIQSFPRSIQIIEGRGFTERQLKQDVIAAHDSVMDSSKVSTAVSYPDIPTGRLIVTVALHERVTTPSEKEAVISQLRSELPSSVNSADVDYEIVDSLPGGTFANVGGGVHLASCTAGFVVENGSGTRNMSTAGHCPDDTYIDDIDFDELIALTDGVDHEGEWGDLQRNVVESGHTLVNTFRYDDGDGDFQYVYDTGVPALGQRLWRYGATTGAWNQRVYKLDVSKGKYDGLVAMHRSNGGAGDSGGPWYDGTTAYGLVHGAKRIGVFMRELFTPVHHMDDAFPGWEVATS